MARPKKSNPLVDTAEERTSVESSDFTFLDGRQSPFDPGPNAGGFKINGSRGNKRGMDACDEETQ